MWKCGNVRMPMPMKLELILFILSCVAAVHMQAQCDSSAQIVNDTLYAVDNGSMLDSSIFVPPNELASYYSFDHQQDSIRFLYIVGEFAKNSQWVYLNHWCLDKVYNFDVVADSAKWEYSNAALSAISRTKTIPVIAGDTLSFFREFYWLDKTNGGIINASKLVSDDAISMSVELIDEISGERIMLIDTVHISTTTQSKKPCIYAWKPAMARIGFLVPNSVTETTSVFLRANVFSGGSSGSSFMRSDMMQVQLSKQQLESSGWQNFSNSVVSENDCTASCYFSMSALSSPRRIEINVDNGQTAINKIMTYDFYGNLFNTTTLPSLPMN